MESQENPNLNAQIPQVQQIQEVQTYDSAFSSAYDPIYTSVNVTTEPTQYVRTPAIPYNYMPRPAYTTTPGEISSYNSVNKQFLYKDENYQQKVNDKLMEKRTLDFSNPTTSADFSPSFSKTSLLS